jgi:hypothetical protein
MLKNETQKYGALHHLDLPEAQGPPWTFSQWVLIIQIKGSGFIITMLSIG